MHPNPGDRPSRLQLDRYAAGELDDAQRAAVEEALDRDEAARGHLAEVEAARAQVRPFDAAAIRARAQGLDLDAAPAPEPANRPFHRSWLVAVALAAVALLLVGPRLFSSDPAGEAPDVRMRAAGAQLLVFRHDGRAVPYAGEAVGEGDVLGFEVLAAGRDRVVILSIDGTGALTVFYPSTGSDGHPLPRGTADAVPLPDGVVLDGAPGPEAFVAVFDATVAAARTAAEARYRDGGVAGLRSWAEAEDAVDVVVVERR